MKKTEGRKSRATVPLTGTIRAANLRSFKNLIFFNSTIFEKESWKTISIVFFFIRLMRRDDDEELEELNNQIEALR
jgi:hypothetical protein